MTVSGGDIPAGATIASIDSATRLTLSAPVTTGTGTTGEALTFTESENGDVPSATLTVELTNVDTTNLVVGMTVSGGDIPAGATIANIDSATQLTLSAPITTGTGTTGEALTFTTTGTGNVPAGAEIVTKTLTGTDADLAVALNTTDLELLEDGIITVFVTQTDEAGNVQGTAANTTFTLDTEAPLGSCHDTQVWS